MKKLEGYIGFLDSGVGGISVLNEAIKVLPEEKYIYFGDSRNAPYGVKAIREVLELTEKNVDFLISLGAKAVVIACNTATSAAAEYLRGKYKKVPIIGVEPALKPAVTAHKGQRIFVMATPMTLAETKFKNLMEEYESCSDIVPVPCDGLMEFVEEGILNGEKLEIFLEHLLCEYMREGAPSAVVLGCTHYPFIKGSIKNVIGEGVQVYDGGLGTARQLKNRLQEMGLLSESSEKGKIEVMNSSEDERIILLSEKLIDV